MRGQGGEYDIDHVCKVMRYLDLGQTLVPVLSDENWKELLAAHELYENSMKGFYTGRDKDIESAAGGYHKFVEQLIAAVQKRCKEKAKKSEAHKKEMDALLERCKDESRSLTQHELNGLFG
jgi:hypothetical protein